MTPQDPRSDQDFVQELRERLRAGEAPDAVTRTRLSAARARALDARISRAGWAPWGVLAGAVTAGLVAATLLLRPASLPSAGESDLAQGEFFEMMLDEDGDDTLYEDLDVLVWLAGEERA